MANNCLITKLKGVVDNSNLEKLGELIIGFSILENPAVTANSIKLMVNERMTLTTTDGYFIETGNPTSMQIDADDQYHTFTVSNTGTKLHIPNKYAITSINMNFSDYASRGDILNINDLKYCPLFSFLGSRSAGLTGDLTIFNEIDGIDYINLDLVDNVSQNIETIDNPSITRIILGNQNSDVLYGSIENLQLLNNPLTYLKFSFSKGIYGNLNNINLPITLVQINFQYTNVEGDIETIAQKMANDGRNSGILLCQCTSSYVKYQGSLVTRNINVYFGSSMVNPTAEETEQGYQIV